MTKKNKDKRNRLADFIRYRNNDMSYSERHAFEKEVQKDPFEEEASEGFSELSSNEIIEDMNRLRSRLSKRTSGRVVPLFYRYAAAITVLVIISSVLLLRDLNRSDMLVSDNIEQKKETGDPAMLTRPEKAVSEISEPTQQETRIGTDSIFLAERITKEEAEPAEKGEEIVEPGTLQLAIVEDDIAVKEVVNEAMGGEAEVIRTDQKAARAADRAMAGEISQPVITGVAFAPEKSDPLSKYISGRVISSEDGLPLPGVKIVVKGKKIGAVTDAEGYFQIESDSNAMLVASFTGMRTREVQATRAAREDISLDADLMALDEVVVVAYAAEKKADQTGAVSTIETNKESGASYSEAEPAGGYNTFRSYIRDNQVFPEDYTGSGREVVRIKLRVNENGYLYDFEIIRSPSSFFSDESVRLLKEGPSWNPSTRDGKPIDDSISLRMVFRR
ncbi:MAG TPA: carboxypeptidase-like regulatory domain-containing protein [Bacteroidales bacterium]|nr:carboxypeptidase-like regulatory domain-containing protein [Bacteroidales bacterium]